MLWWTTQPVGIARQWRHSLASQRRQERHMKSTCRPDRRTWKHRGNRRAAACISRRSRGRTSVWLVDKKQQSQTPRPIISTTLAAYTKIIRGGAFFKHRRENFVAYSQKINHVCRVSLERLFWVPKMRETLGRPRYRPQSITALCRPPSWREKFYLRCHFPKTHPTVHSFAPFACYPL